MHMECVIPLDSKFYALSRCYSGLSTQAIMNHYIHKFFIIYGDFVDFSHDKNGPCQLANPGYEIFIFQSGSIQLL